jgi:hypothetical protein
MAEGDQIIAILTPKLGGSHFDNVEALLRHLYIDEGLSLINVSGRIYTMFKVEVSETMVHKLIKRYGIPTRRACCGKGSWRSSMRKHWRNSPPPINKKEEEECHDAKGGEGG